MATGRRIGLAVDAVASYGRGVIRGIMSFCRANPSWMITVEPRWSFGRLPDISEWSVDGLIVQTFSREFEAQVLKLGLPTTDVSNLLQEPAHLPTVVPDDSAIGEMAAEYLLSLGFRDVGYCWTGHSAYGRRRLEAFEARARQARIRFHECDINRQDLAQWVLDLPKPAAVLGSNDDWAHRILNVARRGGVKVPDELAVMGVDDDELLNSLVTPSLSSIMLPTEQIGFEAAAMLDRIMDGDPPPSEPMRLAPLRVVARESTDVLAVDDANVAAALRFIRERSSEPLQVDDVLEHVALSRRSLERRFKERLGHPIADEIRRVHVERAKHLLLTTDLKLPQIATASGFTSATRLGIVFHKEVGEPPTEFRRRGRLWAGLKKTT